MPRTRKSSSDQENMGSQDLTSKNSRRKRTPSAEMSGMKKSESSAVKRSAGRPRKSDSEKNPELESPDKRRGYEKNLTDDYYQEGARYASYPGERGRTEFDYDMQHRGYDPYWDEPREFGRQSRGGGDITSDYRNRRERGAGSYSSEYMRSRGDVPAGGYYGYQRMQERHSDQYSRPSSRPTENDWERWSDRPYHGSSREEDSYRRSERGPSYGGAWHSDTDYYRSSDRYDDRGSYGRGYDERDLRRGDEYGYGMGSNERSGYDRYEERRHPGQEGWREQDMQEREMRNRRRGGSHNYYGNY